MAILDNQKRLISDLWLDQPDAHERVDAKRRRGELSALECERLQQFTDEGYLILSVSNPPSDYERFNAEIDRLWRDKPRDLALSPFKGKRRSLGDCRDADRTTGYRIKDPHSHSDVIQSFYLHPEVFRYIELIFGQKAIAFQSIYFEFGSRQGLHRDPMFVVTRPPSHLLASWLALEDIEESSGPLKYIPGSHRLPWFEFGPDKVTAQGATVTQLQRKQCREMHDRLCAENGLSEKTLTVPRGQVLIWHGNLLHGGMPVTDPHATRKSYVIHYSTYANYQNRETSMKIDTIVDGNVVTRPVKGATTNILERDGCAGLDNPLLYIDERFRVMRGNERLG